MLRQALLASCAVCFALCSTLVGVAIWALCSLPVQDELHKAVPDVDLDVGDAQAVAALLIVPAVGTVVLAVEELLSTVLALPWSNRRGVRKTKGVAWAVLATVWSGAIVAATIIISTRSAGVSAPGLSKEAFDGILRDHDSRLAYLNQRSLVVVLILGWLSFASALTSLVLFSLGCNHGTFATAETPSPLYDVPEIDWTNPSLTWSRTSTEPTRQLLAPREDGASPPPPREAERAGGTGARNEVEGEEGGDLANGRAGWVTFDDRDRIFG
ncbi:hypothetical protein JCM5296_006640 [Sporobolomyces johnsonii]